MRDSGLVLFQDGVVGIKNGFVILPSIRQGGGPMQLGHVAYWHFSDMPRQPESAIGGEADIPPQGRHFRF